MSTTQPITANVLASCEDALRVAIDYGHWDNTLTAKVRSMVGEELAAMVMATAELNQKALAKLGDGIWWCTQRSLSQATPYQVANLKAGWIKSGAVFDLCSGIGGDTVAIARSSRHRDSVIMAVDRDPTMVAMASENLRLNTTVAEPSHSVVCDEVQNATRCRRDDSH